MKTMLQASFIMVVWLLTVAAALAADTPRLAGIFQDNLILQREKTVPVWGWAKPGAQVEVSFGGQQKQAKANERGYWKVVLDPMKANNEGQVLEMKTGPTVVSRRNVLVGEVWIAAGQSNATDPRPDRGDTGVYPYYTPPPIHGKRPEVRIAWFGWAASLKPEEDIDPVISGKPLWNTLEDHPYPDQTPEPAPNYSARLVRDSLNVPVGIIYVASVGIPQESWISRESMEKFPASNNNKDGKQYANAYEAAMAYWETVLADRKAHPKPPNSLAEFEKMDQQWRVTKKGGWPFSYMTYCPTTMFNSRVFPLAPFAVRGVFTVMAAGAVDHVTAMINEWRKLFDQDFYFIMGTYSRDTHNPVVLQPVRDIFYRETTNHVLWEVKKIYAQDQKMDVVELYDLGDHDVHLWNKAELGRRLGLGLLANAYGQKVIYSGPRMVESKIEGGKATIRFDRVGDGLVYQPNINGISGVFLAGKNVPAQWGQVKVIGKDTIEVSHPAINEITTLAYADSGNPLETLFGSDGLPASPFTINPEATPILWSGGVKSTPTLLQLVEGKAAEAKGAYFDVPHVRRYGYMFYLYNYRGTDKSIKSFSVRALIPNEWKNYVVEAGGKPLPTVESTKDGNRFVTFDAPFAFDGPFADPWVIVAEKDKAADFRKVNRY